MNRMTTLGMYPQPQVAPQIPGIGTPGYRPQVPGIQAAYIPYVIPRLTQQSQIPGVTPQYTTYPQQQVAPAYNSYLQPQVAPQIPEVIPQSIPGVMQLMSNPVQPQLMTTYTTQPTLPQQQIPGVQPLYNAYTIPGLTQQPVGISPEFMSNGCLLQSQSNYLQNGIPNEAENMYNFFYSSSKTKT